MARDERSSRRAGASILSSALLTAALAQGLVGCGDAHRRPPRGRPGSSSSEPTGISASARALRAGQHGLGDYDEDDPYDRDGRQDGDNDDHRRRSDRDGDGDATPGDDAYDRDDAPIVRWGRAADPSDSSAVAHLIRRYYAAAAGGEGARACSLIYAPLARSLPEDLGRGGPRYLRGGRTCAAIASKLFDQNHFQLKSYDATLRVRAVRVMGGLGLALLSFHRRPSRVAEVIRDRDVWRMYSPLDEEMP